MQGKTMYRLLGFLVVVSLVIILMPFFQTQKQLSSEVALMKAPPFPDQPVQVAANEPANMSAAQPLPMQTQQNGVNQQPDDVINPNRPMVMQNAQVSTDATPSIAPTVLPTEAVPPVADNAITTPAPIVDSGDQKVVAQMIDEEVATPAEAITVKKAVLIKPIHTKQNGKHVAKLAQIKPVKKLVAHNQKAPAPVLQQASNGNNGLISLKNQAWVIQVGSYKNKANALRVVNRLRASGYRAFIQTAVDDTWVFIGPENKRTAAHSVASRLQSEMNIHGIVISYQPLSL